MMDNKARLQRIRDAQIKARDPGPSKIRNYDWDKHAKLASRYKQRPLLTDFILSMPYRWRGLLMGLCFGAGVAFFLDILLLGDDTHVLLLIPILVALLIGYVIGKIMEDPVQM